MKCSEYDSPFEFIAGDITAQMARNADEMCWQAVQKVGINMDKDKLLAALKQDAERYREAYAKGYEKRDDDIVRCKDCRDYMTVYCTCDDCCISDDWFCANGRRRDYNEKE